MFAGRGRGKIRPPRRVSQECTCQMSFSALISVLYCHDRLLELWMYWMSGSLDFGTLRGNWSLANGTLHVNHGGSMTASKV